MSTTLIAVLAAAGSVVAGSGIGFALGWKAGRGEYAKVVGEQSERLANLYAEIKALEFEIVALVASPPSVDDARRLLHKISGDDAA